MVRRSTTKTDAGERVIPLNADAWAAVLELRERAKLLFGREPDTDWFVFPHKEGFTKPDPTRPMSGWRTAWRKLTRAISCPACGHLQQPGEMCRNEKCGADIHSVRSPLHGFRFHDCRHSRDHRALRGASERQHHPGDSRPRLPEDARPLLACAHGRQAQGNRSALKRRFRGWLRHKPRHKIARRAYTAAASD